MDKAVIILLALALVVAGAAVCSNGGFMSTGQFDNSGLTWDNPQRSASARATDAASEMERKNAEADLAVKRSIAQAAVQATKEAVQADVNSKLIVATMEAGARADTIRAQGQANVSATTALGHAAYLFLSALGVGLAIAVVVLATGHSIVHVRQAALTSGYVRIGVEPLTLLPPPLVITRDGYLIDTRTGERARLRDAAGVHRLRLAATTHATETALLAQAEARIAETTKSDKAADALMGAAGAIPMLETNERSM